MSDQFDIFEQPRPDPKCFGTKAKEMARYRDPSTSVDAAVSMEKESARLERQVYDIIAGFGEAGCISDDVVKAMTHVGIQTVTPRYKALKKKGLIEEVMTPDGKNEKRVGTSGHKQMVLRVKIK